MINNRKIEKWHSLDILSGEYDLNNISYDASRGISNIAYNYQGLPTTITLDNGGSQNNSYDAAGALVYKVNNTAGSFSITTVRTYLNDYDFHARRLNSATALWNTPDPLASKYPGINPYVYCAANPILYADPTGADGEVTIENDMITISVNIYIYGNGASNEKALIMQQNIMNYWNINSETGRNWEYYDSSKPILKKYNKYEKSTEFKTTINYNKGKY